MQTLDDHECKPVVEFPLSSAHDSFVRKSPGCVDDADTVESVDVGLPFELRTAIKSEIINPSYGDVPSSIASVQSNDVGSSENSHSSDSFCGRFAADSRSSESALNLSKLHLKRSADQTVYFCRVE
jgi:hypothetical protein